jgi:hypothetical protein
VSAVRPLEHAASATPAAKTTMTLPNDCNRISCSVPPNANLTGMNPPRQCGET